jgi:hypothetical protein
MGTRPSLAECPWDSITSSARARRIGGTVIPSAFAVRVWLYLKERFLSQRLHADYNASGAS